MANRSAGSVKDDSEVTDAIAIERTVDDCRSCDDVTIAADLDLLAALAVLMGAGALVAWRVVPGSAGSRRDLCAGAGRPVRSGTGAHGTLSPGLSR